MNSFEFEESACRDVKFNWTIPNYKNISGGELTTTLSSLNMNLIFKETPGLSSKLKIGLSNANVDLSDSSSFFTFKVRDFSGKTLGQDFIECRFSQSNPECFSREISKPRGTDEIHRHYVAVKGHIVLRQRRETVETVSQSTDESVIQLQQDFKQCLQSGEAADVTLEVDNEQFKVHKFVLCARSLVFRRMFANEMAENRLNRIRIDDMQADVLKDFLAFLYCGETGRLSFEATCELYSAADKYDIQTLQKSCRRKLTSCLSNDNVCEILELADRHGDFLLEEFAALFISDNFSSVSDSANWKRLIQSSPLLASRTLQKVSDNMSIKA